MISLLPLLYPVCLGWSLSYSMRPALKSKVTLLARLNTEGFPFVKATFKNCGIKLPIERNGKYFEPERIMGFYARYSKMGGAVQSRWAKTRSIPYPGSRASRPTMLGNNKDCFRSTYRNIAPGSINLLPVPNSSWRTSSLAD